jgi:hypothetical protein
MRAFGVGLRSSTQDVSATAGSRPDLALRSEVPVVKAAARYVHGAMSGFLRLLYLSGTGQWSYTYGSCVIAYRT